MTGARSFHALALTQALSALGSRMSGVAIGFAVYASTGKTAPLLLFPFFNELPAMAIGALAGAIVDRRDCRRILILSDAGQALGSLGLVAAFLSGAFEPWMLYAIGFWQGICAAFQTPAKDLLIARLVPDEGRDRANALLYLSHPAAGILAPAFAGALYPLVGVAGVVAVDLGTFLAAALAISALSLPSRPAASSAAPSASLLKGLGEAFAFLRQKPALGLLLLYAALMNFLLNGPLELALPYSLARAGSAEAAGFALSLQGFGGVAGSAFLAWRGQTRSRIGSISLGLSGAGLLLIALALSRSTLLLGLSLFGIIACLQVWSRLTSIYQAEAPLELQGRIGALAGQLGFLGSTASFALAGPLVDRWLEPAAVAGWGKSAWLAAAFGTGRGGGMGLLIAGAGALIVAFTLGLRLLPGVGGLGAQAGAS